MPMLNYLGFNCAECDFPRNEMQNNSNDEKEFIMWSQLMVVTASHYEAVRCAEVKKAAMIILIQRVRSRECPTKNSNVCVRCNALKTHLKTHNEEKYKNDRPGDDCTL